MANILTSIRILCAVVLLFCPTFSKAFFAIYLLGAFTDAIDGTVARKTNTVSKFGSKLDTIADAVFVVCVLVKIISVLYFEPWLLIWIAAIFFVKIASIVAGYIKHHEFVAMHSVLNKVCGAVAFFIPLFIGGDYARQGKAIGVIFLCILASIAAVWELLTVLKMEKYTDGEI